MARVTATEVKQIIQTNLSDTIVDADIGSATELIDQYIADASCHDTTSLTKVELWLSAHFVSIREKELSQEALGDASQTRRAPGVLQTGLESSYYGQTALLFDCSGILAGLGKRGVQFEAFGGAGTAGYSST